MKKDKSNQVTMLRKRAEIDDRLILRVKAKMEIEEITFDEFCAFMQVTEHWAASFFELQFVRIAAKFKDRIDLFLQSDKETIESIYEGNERKKDGKEQAKQKKPLVGQEEISIKVERTLPRIWADEGKLTQQYLKRDRAFRQSL